jgi:hypothetical protein
VNIFSIVSLTCASIAFSQPPSPADVIGFVPGSDYKLANWDQLVEYYRALDDASDRVQLVEIGRSVLQKPLLLLYISSEDNLSRLEDWREMSESLARARIDDATARRYADEGKAIVWLDAGLHATEVAPSQMMPHLAYRIVTEDSAEMQKIRDNVIVLLMPCMNPDGLDIVASWYQRNLGTPFETTRPPELYHHYVGHDNNRDWFMNNMPESKAVTEVLYRKWYPQIVYNHHQTGPAWARIFLPPFADPVNPNIHPGVTTAVNMVGTAMANRFAMQQMPGVVSDMTYSMWWNGGMRTVPYFHNMIGILTETSHSSPTPRYYDPEKRPEFVGNPRRGNRAPTSATDVFYPYPWEGGDSRFADAVRYTLTASMGVLDIAADLRQKWLYDIYRMGRDAIERGEASAPAAYIIPAGQDQWDPGEADALVNVLLIGGVEIEQASSEFTVDGKRYGAGSYIVSGAQAFLPFVIDLMEAQDYPDRRRTPDGPPDPPYDLAGWTLPMQMGVTVDRVTTAVNAEANRLSDYVTPRPGQVSSGRVGYLLSHRPNASVVAVNRLLAMGESVHWAGDALGDDHPRGTILVEAGSDTEARLETLARELGVDFVGIDETPDVVMHTLRPVRVGMYKSYVANMDEGWTRWLLEDYDFDLTSLHDEDLRTKDLSAFDVIVLPHQSAERILNGHATGTMPDAYVGGMGLRGAMELERFVEAGGTLVALDGASDFAIEQFGLPLKNVTAGVASSKFFIPGSLVRADVDTDHPLAWGMQEEVATSFVRSRAFDIVELTREREGGREETKTPPRLPVENVVTYAEEDILMSGWALGEENHIGGKGAVVRVRLGQGEIILFAFRPQFRGQPRGTYKLFFNALHGATLEDMPWSVVTDSSGE